MNVTDKDPISYKRLYKNDKRAFDCTINEYKAIPGTCRWCGVHLQRTKTGKIDRKRRWCSQGCAQESFQQHNWNAAKKAVKRRDGHKCQSCGIDRDKAHIQVHHIHPRRGENHSTSCLNHHRNLICLCHYCHMIISQWQQEARKEGRSDVFGWEALPHIR